MCPNYLTAKEHILQLQDTVCKIVATITEITSHFFTYQTNNLFVLCTLKLYHIFRISFSPWWVGWVRDITTFFCASLLLSHTCLCLAVTSKMLLLWPQTKHPVTNRCQIYMYICMENPSRIAFQNRQFLKVPP